MRYFYYFIIFICAPLLMNAQVNKVPVLEREISITVSNEPVHQVLEEISKKADFVFSYNPESIGANATISLDIRQKSVRHILNIIFTGSVKYKVRGKYVILQKDELYAESLKNSKQKITVEGYITEAGSGQKLNNVTIYNKDFLASANTDKYGYFKIEIPQDKKNEELHICKQGYSDTLIANIEKKKNYVTVELSSKNKGKESDSLKNKTFLRNLSFSKINSDVTQWFISKKLWMSSLNIQDTVFRKVQFSFLPFLGTNKLFTGNAVNKYSFNILAGYIQGLDGIEFGGIQNIVRNNARYAQFAGVGNIVGGSFEGFQGAGVYNITSRSFNGVQSAGVFNIVRDNLIGVQLSGVWNISRYKCYGVQLAGVYNMSEFLNGVQIGGVLNIIKKDSGACQIAGVTNISGATFNGVQIAGVNNVSEKIDGAQIGGVLNTATEISGVQISGVVNIASQTDGTQIAGVVNCTNNLDGVQISGCLNRATFFNGTQISLINIADSCDGISIGLLNFIRKGYHKIEFSADEIFYSNIALRTGTRHFYNIFMAGIKPDNFSNPLWTFGYGLGSNFGNSDKLTYDLDLSLQQIIKGGDFSVNNNLFKIYAGADLKLFPKISLAVGVTYNFLVTDISNPSYDKSFSNLAPYKLSNTTSKNGFNLKTWLGGKIAIRFL